IVRGYFFFSSRRRHTRFSRDWSSDVCSSDLAETGATLVHPYKDRQVIAGQGTAALELLAEAGHLDALMTPLGGGGLLGGTAITARARAGDIAVFGAEPEGAADGIASLAAGHVVPAIGPETICVGLRGTIGDPKLALSQKHRVQLCPVSDA